MSQLDDNSITDEDLKALCDVVLKRLRERNLLANSMDFCLSKLKEDEVLDVLTMLSRSLKTRITADGYPEVEDTYYVV